MFVVDAWCLDLELSHTISWVMKVDHWTKWLDEMDTMCNPKNVEISTLIYNVPIF
jgi:hypothetical protein